MLALVVVVTALLSGDPSSAQSLGCAMTQGDWFNISNALTQRYYYSILEPAGFCANTSVSNSSLFAHYGSCSQTLSQVLATQGITQNCTGYLASILYNGPGIVDSYDTVSARCAEICTSQSLSSAVTNYFCNPLRTVGCPRQLDIIKFAVFQKCHEDALRNLTLAQIENYFDTNQDKICMVRNDVCASLASWTTCPVIVQQIFDFIDQSHTYTCENMFPTVEERCQLTYEKNNENYCPPPTLFQQNEYTILITCTVGPVVLLLLFLCYKRVYRASHISSGEILDQAKAVDSSGQSLRMYHPELAAIVESKYKGVTFNQATGEWAVKGKAEKFQDEQAAARFAYLNLANHPAKTLTTTASQSSFSSPGDFAGSAAYNMEETEYVVTAKPLTPEQIKARRLQQLIAFYEYWEPAKQDIPEHAENLLNRHDFEHVARAVKTKYGVLPPGWAEELEV